MNQKGFANIILIVVIVAIVAVGGYFIFSKKSGPITQQPTPTHTETTVPTKTPVSPTPTPKDETANWKTYTNAQYGFEFKYPVDHKIENDGDSLIIVGPRFIEAGCDDCMRIEIQPLKGSIAGVLFSQANDPNFTTKKQIDFNGFPAFEIWHEGDIHWGNDHFILMERGGTAFYFAKPQSADLQTVVNTFKFTK